MKKIFLLLPLFSATATYAQTSKYQAAITQQVAALDTTRSEAGLQKLGAAFERIADAEKTQWLPYYYASFCAIRAVRFERDLNLVDSKLDRAEILTQKTAALSPNNSEVFCLNALIDFARINVDFMARGPEYSALANAALQQARELNPANPRVYLLIGQSKYSTPEQFGGDKKGGCQFIEKAAALFATAPASPIDPHWGKGEVARYQSLCQAPATAAK